LCDTQDKEVDSEPSGDVCDFSNISQTEMPKDFYGDFTIQYSDISSAEEEGPLENCHRFSTPASELQLAAVAQKQIPHKTAKSLSWAVNLFEEWRKNRNRLILKGKCSPNLQLIPSHLASLQPQANYKLCSL
jgi:hypothetical protein